VRKFFFLPIVLGSISEATLDGRGRLTLPKEVRERYGERVLTAATYVEDHGFTPFDALHLVESDGDTVVSSDETYESFAPPLDLKAVEDE